MSTNRELDLGRLRRYRVLPVAWWLSILTRLMVSMVTSNGPWQAAAWKN